MCYEPNKPYVKILKNLKLSNLLVYDYGISKQNKNLKVFSALQIFKKNLDLITYTFYNKKDLIKQIETDFRFKKGISIIQTSINLKKIKNVKYKISLVKIDVNGHEYSVVKGLENIIKKDKPVLIIETDKNIKKLNGF